MAIFTLSRSSLNFHEIVATNLAREGIEVVRMMRDTNWLEGDHRGTDAFALDKDCGSDPPGGQNNANENSMDGKVCYPSWLNGPNGSGYHNYVINQSTNQNRWRLEYDIGGRDWDLANNRNYNLYLQNDGSYTHQSNGVSVYARKINITYNVQAPYTPRNPEVIVQAVVGWRDKNCTAMTGQDPETTGCNVVLEERLTNWKDYE